ncbi:hypothetical protein [Sphingomonas montanisoli]|uniref:Uncharacterized protein n=1 Tax=Sphingomonas montanisoli TaxID=2606412 RepID=A0A5D9BXI6_9SPHN|nr:hypothetical protein [Sphingomonas montanisoli]TZG24114.1 hypothetical protein FYJ91_19970 [Sphingomonas montanisoli]
MNAMTDEEYQQLQSQVAAEAQRRAMDTAAANAERIAPLMAITASEAFGTLKAAVEALPAELAADAVIGPCINAIKVGMAGVLKFAPGPAPDGGN